jgi:glyoxylase-like metal-dependent hydrolase (beta-lactamase superfamily II)
MSGGGPRWSDPEVEELGGGVYRIPLPLPTDALRAVNVYAIADSRGVSLIDAGMAIAVDRAGLERALRGIGFGFGDIRAFYVTHFHRDHYPLALEIRREYGTPVALGELERYNIELIKQVVDGSAASRIDASVTSFGGGHLVTELAAARQGHRSADLYEDPDWWLSDGARLEVPGRDLEVLATPGHTRGHVSYRDQGNRLLFAGDHVLPHITPSIGFEPAATGRALSDFLTSLARLRAMPDTALLPAHGRVAPSTHRRIDELLSHHDKRLAQALAACDGTWRSGFDVAQELTWTRRERPFGQLSCFDQALAVSETDAHLRLLTARGRLVTRTGQDGVIRYREPT